ncbi:MAG: M64 family metallopeptidase [Chloroflexota bacterium]
MSTSDGRVVGATRLVDHGPDSARWDLVVMGDGYREAELAKFATDAETIVNQLLASPPFDQIQAAINVHRIDVVSTDSGADMAAACSDTTDVRTYFDTAYCDGGLHRLMSVNYETAYLTATEFVPEWDVILVIVNSTAWGGAGGGEVAVISLAPGAVEGALHEIGHILGLADEYDYWWGWQKQDEIDRDNEEGRDHYEGPEPPEPNVTANTDRETLKWRHLVLPGTDIPTTENPNCLDVDRSPSPVPVGTVGLFEGANYNHCGAYRPVYRCRMFDETPAYCAVCQEHIRETLSHYLPRRKRMDFTVITPTMHQFGNQNTSLPGVYVGREKEWTFDCPGIDAGQHAVLVFQSRHARAFSNWLSINDVTVPGVVPMNTTDPDAWNSNVLLVNPNTLRSGGNVLRIKAATEQLSVPPGQPPRTSIDEFVVDNVVLMYKTA